MRAPADGKLFNMCVQTESEPKRVLIVTSSVGSGHNAAARAIADRLALVAPDLQVSVVDTLSFAPRALAALYSGIFALGMSRFPRIYGLGFWATNRPQHPDRGAVERCRLRLEHAAMRAFRDHLLTLRPAMIVSTHFLAPPVVSRLISQGRILADQFVVVTDIEVHRYWYTENIDRWFVPAQCSAAQLSAWRIRASNVVVSGIPIHQKWTKPIDREVAAKEWQLPSDRNIVLLSGGTDFTCGPVVKIARQIAATSASPYVVVLAGRNKKLLRGLAQLPETPDSILPLGFTDRAYELAELSSLVVTKAGGITTAECLAKAKPMVFLRPVPGHEARNARYFASHGAAVIARSSSDVANIVSQLLVDKQRLEDMAAKAGGLYRPGTETIADAICAALSGRRVRRS